MNATVCADLDVQVSSLGTHRAFMFPATVFTLVVLILFLFIFVILWCAEMKCCRRKRRWMWCINQLSNATRTSISQGVCHNVTSLIPRYLAMYPEHFPPQPWFDGIKKNWKSKLQEALMAADTSLIWHKLVEQASRENKVTDLKIFWTPARCHGATTAEVNSVKFMTTLTTQESKIESDQILRLEITVEQVLRELVLDSLFPDIFLQQEGYVQDATDKISEHAAKEIGYQRCTVRVFRKETVEHALDSGPEGHPGDSSQGTQTDTDGGLCILITSVLEIPNWQRKVEKFERDGIINSSSEKWHIETYMDGFSSVSRNNKYYQRNDNNGRLGDKYLWLYHWVLPRCVFPKKMLTFLVAFLVFWGLAVSDMYAYNTTQRDYCTTEGFCVENQDCFITNIGPNASKIGLVRWWESTFSTKAHTPNKGEFARCDIVQQINGVFCYRKLLLSPTNVLSSLGIAWSVYQVLIGVDALADLLPRYRSVSAVLLVVSFAAVMLSIDGMIDPWTNPTEYVPVLLYVRGTFAERTLRYDVSFLGYYVLFLVAILILSYSFRHLIVTELGLIDTFFSCQKEYRKHTALRTMQMMAARSENVPITAQDLYTNLQATRCTKHACLSKSAFENCIDVIKSGWSRNYQELFGNPRKSAGCGCCGCCAGHQIEVGCSLDTQTLDLVCQTLQYLHEEGKVLKVPAEGQPEPLHTEQPEKREQLSVLRSTGEDRWIIAPKLPWKAISHLWVKITSRIKSEMEKMSREVKRSLLKVKGHSLVAPHLALLEDDVQRFTEHAIRTLQEVIWSKVQEDVAAMVQNVYAKLTSAASGLVQGTVPTNIDGWYTKYCALVVQIRTTVQTALAAALQLQLKMATNTPLHHDVQEFVDAIRGSDLMGLRGKEALTNLINKYVGTASTEQSIEDEPHIEPRTSLPEWGLQLPSTLKNILKDPGSAIIEHIEPSYIIGLALTALSWIRYDRQMTVHIHAYTCNVRITPRRFNPSVDLDPEALFSFIPDINGIKAKIGLYRSVSGQEDDSFNILLASTQQQLQKVQRKLISQRPSITRML